MPRGAKVKFSPEERFWQKVNKTTSCWLWTGYSGRRYGQLRVVGKMIKAHRFSYELHIGTIPSGLYVCHKCDNPLCVNPKHLFLGTQFDNMRDMNLKGRGNKAKGSKASRSRLSQEQVLAMRVEFDSGNDVSYASLGRKYGVTNVAAKMVVNRKVWKHI